MKSDHQNEASSDAVNLFHFKKKNYLLIRAVASAEWSGRLASPTALLLLLYGAHPDSRKQQTTNTETHFQWIKAPCTSFSGERGSSKVLLCTVAALVQMMHLWVRPQRAIDLWQSLFYFLCVNSKSCSPTVTSVLFCTPFTCLVLPFAPVNVHFFHLALLFVEEKYLHCCCHCFHYRHFSG